MRSILPHFPWLLVTIGAFAIGAMRTDGDGRPSDEKTEGRQSFASGKPQPKHTLSALSPSAKDGRANDTAANRPLSTNDIRQFGRTLQTEGSPVARRLAFAKLLEGVTAENALMIREQLMGLNTNSREWRDFHYAWGTIAGSDAVAHGMESPEHDMAITLSGWASTDPTAAMAWFESLPADQRAQNGDLKYGLAGGLADRNPDEAAAFAFDLATSGDGDAQRVLSNVASQVIRYEGVESAAAWTESLQAGEMRAAAMDRVANAFVRDDPAAAMSWAGQFNSEPHSARIIEEVADEVSRNDPEQALGWLASLAPSEGRNQGYRSTFRRFTRANPQAATSQVTTIPGAAERDAALTGIAMTVGRYQHEAAAFDYIGQIGDYETRVAAVQLAAPEFASITLPSLASEWVTSNLSSSVSSFAQEFSPNSEAREAAAVEWIATLPEGESRASAEQSLGRDRGR